jgi:hypothetical protein
MRHWNVTGPRCGARHRRNLVVPPWRRRLALRIRVTWPKRMAQRSNHRTRTVRRTAALVAIAITASVSGPLSHKTDAELPDRTDCVDDWRTSLKEAIEQNTSRKQQPAPAGVPRDWSWYNGKSGVHAAAPPPPGFSAVTGWGIVYPEGGRPASSTNAVVFMKDFVTFLHLASRGWMEVQNQAKDAIGGAHFAANFSGNRNVPWTARSLSGGIAFDAPKIGYNDHFWPEKRGTFGSEQIDGVFVSARLKTDTPGVALVAALGADWWRDAAATYEAGFANNPGIGQSNFVRLATRWQTLFFHSLSTESLEADFARLPLKYSR